MLDYNTTLILFGRSPFINEIKDDIPKLIAKYHTMGCNYFVDTFPEVEYCIFYDDIVPKVTNKTKIITNIRHFKEPRKKSQKLCIAHQQQAEFYEIITHQRTQFSNKAGRLHFYLHTPSMALNWAWQKGFKTVVIAGIDLTLAHPQHFDCDHTPDQDSFTLKDSTVMNSRWHLENTASKYLKLYQLNPKSTMNLEKISMEELLK